MKAALCPGCLTPRKSTGTCPHCGWRATAESRSPLYLQPGSILNRRYWVGRVLGHGGFGITYLAYDHTLGVKLAIKEFFPRQAVTRSEGQRAITVIPGPTRKLFLSGRQKFLDEARCLARFEDQSAVVTVKDFFEENGTAYLVMAYIDGVTLKGHLKARRGRLPFDQALAVMIPLLKALGGIHAAGLLHRDISPDNVYITRNGQVKLLDFGAARQAVGEQTQSLSVILKPGYAPEEQYRPGGGQGPWTDVYAAASTMYEMLTGDTPPMALERVHEDHLQPPSALGVSMPGTAEEALLKALAVKSADRFPTAADFLKALTAHRQPGTVTQQLPKGPFVEPKGRRVLSGWVFGLVGAAALIALIAVGAVLLFQRPTPRPEARITPMHAIPVDSIAGVADRKRVIFDATTSADGKGSLRITVDQPTTVHLYTVPGRDLEKAVFLYSAWVKGTDLEKTAYLEMACVVDGMGVSYSKGLNTPIPEDAGWVQQRIPFLLREGQKLEWVRLEVTFTGPGTVWVDDIHLATAPLPEDL